jgi:hypothetical protein
MFNISSLLVEVSDGQKEPQRSNGKYTYTHTHTHRGLPIVECNAINCRNVANE